jgi:hypothetical protein
VRFVFKGFKIRRYGTSSVMWLHIYPVHVGVCTVHRVRKKKFCVFNYKCYCVITCRDMDLCSANRFARPNI